MLVGNKLMTESFVTKLHNLKKDLLVAIAYLLRALL